MRVELVEDKDPRAQRVFSHRLGHMRCEIGFGTGVADGRCDDPTGGDLEIGDQALGAVADVLELAAFDQTRLHGQGGEETFQRLNAGLLVTADEMHPCGVQAGASA